MICYEIVYLWMIDTGFSSSSMVYYVQAHCMMHRTISEMI